VSDKEEEKAEDFVSLSILVEAVLAQSREAFLEKHPEALILLDNPGDDAENASFQTIDVAGSGTSTAEGDKAVARLRQRGAYVFVLKRQKKKFASMVTVGRAANNAMRLNIGSVSKFHAYFTHVARDKCWYLADAHSSNGTFIDGKELPPSHGKQKLENGSTLRFGPDVTAQYFDAAGLWDQLHERVEGKGGEPDEPEEQPEAPSA
jgi:hypothetical protein